MNTNVSHFVACEAELRQLRKVTSDYESHNAVLQLHVDTLHTAVNELESEIYQQRTTNQALQRHLDTLRSQLATCFANIPLPGECHAGMSQFDILFAIIQNTFDFLRDT